MHPRGLRCSSFKYSEYSQSSRLARGAPRRPRCDAGVSPRAAGRPRLVTALAALLLVLQAGPPAPAIAVDPAIAAVVMRFYETQEKEDIEGYLALWSPNAASPQRRVQAQYVFDQGDDVFSDIVVTQVSIKGDTARLRVNVRRTRTVPRPPGGSPLVMSSAMSVALALERVGGEWKLLSEGPAADHVAEILLEASSDAEKDAVLAAESELAGLPLLSA